MEIKYINKMPAVEEINELTDSVGWGRREIKILEEAIRHTLFSVCAYDGSKIVGLGRVIGDKTIFIHIHDVIVRPDYQNKKIGKGIMIKILEEIEKSKKISPNIRVYLGASKGKEEFYEKFGFVRRPTDEIGAGMILK